MKQPLAILIAMAFVGTAMTAMASTGQVIWTGEADFESNAVTVGTTTTRSNIDTTSSPGDVKIGIAKDFVTTATITSVTSLNKIYTTGFDRNSIAVINSTTMALVGTIPLPGQVAGIVYNSTNNKLYVGQKNLNNVSVIDVTTDTIINTLTIGTTANTVYAAAYNPVNNKVYIANIGDQAVTILDGASDTPLGAPTKVTTGATTATFDSVANKLYLTNKYNNYLTIIDGVTDQMVQDIQVQPVLSLLGGQAAGNVGLRVNAQSLGITSADNVQLSWNADNLGPNQNIQFQVRTAQDVPSLDSATYSGPDGTANTWYDLSTAGVSSVTQGDGTVTNTLQLSTPFTAAAELMLKLSYDGVISPVLHQVSLSYNFTINASAGNGGSISPSGAISVISGGSQTFAISPYTGYYIVDVSVDGVSQGAIGSYTFSNVTANHTISATFAICTYTITATAGSGGSISPSGAVTVNYGGSQTFGITPDTGYYITSVMVDGVSQGAINSYTFSNVTANHTISATFAMYTYTITATAGSGGSVSPSGAVTVNYGGSQTYSITPNTGYYIASVTVDGVSQGAINSYTFSNVTANHTISATFAMYTYTITATSGSGGGISPAGAVTVNYGASQTFGITPNTGYYITSVTVDGVSQGAISSYTFSSVTANHTISATFAMYTYTITATAGSGGSISPSGAVTVNYGGSQAFGITPNTGYYIASVTVDGVSQGAISSYNFSSVTANHTITATFAANAYTVTFTAGAGGSITGTAVQTVTYGGSTTPVTAVPSAGYKLVNWTGTNGFVATTANPLTVTNVVATQNITANFAPIFSHSWQVPATGSYAVAVDSGGNVYTTAGSGIAKFAPSNGAQVWAAPLNDSTARGISLDAAGNVYTASPSLFAKFTPPATTAVWSGSTGDGYSIVADASGNIYGADYSGFLSFYTFTPPSTYTLNRSVMRSYPTQGIALDSANDLFYLDYYGDYGYFAPGQSTPAKNTKIFTNTQIHSIAIDNNNNSYVLASDNGGTLSRIPHGSTSANWTVTGVGSILDGVAVDAIGNVYVATGSSINMYTPALGTGVQWSTTITAGYVGGVAVDPTGKYVAAIEYTNNKVDLYTRN